MKLSKIKIEELANEIKDFLIENDYDANVYFNNKKMSFKIYDENWKRLKTPEVIMKDDVCPLDYFKYANVRHILSMSFEGELYNSINYGYGGVYRTLEDIFNRYGLYFEQGNAWNLTVYPNDGDYSEIEYVDYADKKEKDPIYIGMNKKENVPGELISVMDEWYKASLRQGDVGSAVIGSGFTFNYKDDNYFMSACSPYQGSCSWESSIDVVRKSLQDIGATNITYNWGVMD